jgi:hypothetical protein
MREYPFDWMLYSAFAAGAHLKDGSEKEYATALKYIPYFSGIVDAIFSTGEPGQRFINTCVKYFENIVTAHEQGRKRVITTFCFSPALFYAMDIAPICLEILSGVMTLTYKRGTAEFLDYCNEIGFTETSCSSQRGALGGYLAGVGHEVDMIVTDTPGVCDTNANAFAFASTYLNKPFFQLDFPPVLVGDRSDEYHREDYRALIRFLEEHTGKQLDSDHLKLILSEIRIQDELIAELEEYGRVVPTPLPVAANFMIYVSRFLFAGMPECTILLKSLVKQAQSNITNNRTGLKSGKERVRAFFCYIDHYSQHLRLWKMLDELGIAPAGNILSKHWPESAAYAYEMGRSDAVYTIDTSSTETMIDSLARLNSRMPMVKSIRGPYDARDMWLEDTLAMAKMYSVDCIVYNGTPGCRNTWGMLKLFARDTEKAGFPTHIMYGDAFDDRVESWESTRERFEEFLNVRRLLS